MDGSDSKINRREFLQKGAVVAAGSAAMNSTALSYARIAGANDRISLGHIGVGGGDLDAGALPFAGAEDDRGGRQRQLLRKADG